MTRKSQKRKRARRKLRRQCPKVLVITGDGTHHWYPLTRKVVRRYREDTERHMAICAEILASQ